MELPAFLTLRRVVLYSTVLLILSFFGLLITANMMNRRGIKELQVLKAEIGKYETETRVLDHDIATYSSLIRIEQRARELGMEPLKTVEYLK